MDELFETIGPSKVTAVINHNQFIQGCNEHPSLKIARIKEMPLIDPVSMLYEVRTKNSLSSKTTRLQEQKNVVRKALPSIEADGSQITSMVFSSAGYTVSHPSLLNNSFISIILFTIDSKISLLRPNDAISAVEKFKKDCASSLDGDKNLFKTFGFSRKKNYSINTLKTVIQDPYTDKILHANEEAVLFFGKLLGKQVITYNLETGERCDFNKGDPMLFVYKNGHYELYNVEKIEEITKHIFELFTSIFTLDSVKSSYAKLRQLAKAIGVKCSTKDEILQHIKCFTS
jgi:hypothetical protein